MSLGCAKLRWVNTESKVLLHFDNRKHNLAAPDDFTEVVKMMNHTLLWDADSLLILLVIFASMAWSMASESTVLGLSDLAWSSRFL